MAAIESVVELDPEPLLLPDPSEDLGGSDSDESAEEAMQNALLDAAGGDAAAVLQQLLPKFMRLHEGFRNKVLAQRVGGLYEQVDEARGRVLQAAAEALVMARDLLPYGRHKPYLSVDHANKALWVRQGSVNARHAEAKGLIRPRDRCVMKDIGYAGDLLGFGYQTCDICLMHCSRRFVGNTTISNLYDFTLMACGFPASMLKTWSNKHAPTTTATTRR